MGEQERYRDMLFGADMNYGTWMPRPRQAGRRRELAATAAVTFVRICTEGRQGDVGDGTGKKRPQCPRWTETDRTEEKCGGRGRERDEANNVDIN